MKGKKDKKPATVLVRAGSRSGKLGLFCKKRTLKMVFQKDFSYVLPSTEEVMKYALYSHSDRF